MNKKLLIGAIFLVTILITCNFSFKVQAEEDYSRDYDSNGAVGFYGKYVFPSEEEELPSEPVKPTPKPKPSVTLPQTGEELNVYTIIMGSIFTATAVSVIYSRKKRENKERN